MGRTQPSDIRILLCLILALCLFTPTYASPILADGFSNVLVSRGATLNNETGQPRVFKDGQQVPQGPATDGAGSNFNVPAIAWIAFCVLIGPPLALAGIRGWRFTTGAGIGLGASVCAYAAIINTVDEVGITDLVLSFIVFAFFFLGFVLGLFEVGRLGGITLIGLSGGLAFGIRVVLAKDSLLLSAEGLYFVNWVIVAIFSAAGGLVLIWYQRAGLLFGCASSGSFLMALGLDLVISKQSGMSRGLRFLFDRNSSHLVDIVQQGYHPTLLTRIIIYVSIALTPVLAYGQHRIFSHPFSRKPIPSDEELQVDYPSEEKSRSSRPATYLINLWEGAKFRSANRFSLDSAKGPRY